MSHKFYKFEKSMFEWVITIIEHRFTSSTNSLKITVKFIKLTKSTLSVVPGWLTLAQKMKSWKGNVLFYKK